MKILGTALIYFLIVFGTGFILGPIRVLYLEPHLGDTGAVLCEAPFLIIAMVVGSRIAPNAAHLAPTPGAMLIVGLIALGLVEIAELGVGVVLRGMSLQDQMSKFATVAGAIYGALLLVFALMPWLRATQS